MNLYHMLFISLLLQIKLRTKVLQEAFLFRLEGKTSVTLSLKALSQHQCHKLKLGVCIEMSHTKSFQIAGIGDLLTFFIVGPLSNPFLELVVFFADLLF